MESMAGTEKIIPVSSESPDQDEALEQVEEAASQNGAPVATDAEESSEPEPEPVSELEQAIADRDAAAQQRDELVDQLKRSQAEFENIRKRLYKEKQDVVQYAASDTISSLLPIVDDFERAIETEGLDPEIKKGLELIYKRLFEVFSRAGLREVDQHEWFDPYLHFAVDRAPAEEGQEDQTILDVYQKGYHFKDRLLRASMVKVAVKE